MIRKSCFTVAALFSIVTVTLLNGCGSDNKEGTAAVFTRVSEATCAQCGKATQVPFEPREGRAVYCRDCYNSIRASR